MASMRYDLGSETWISNSGLPASLPTLAADCPTTLRTSVR